MNHLANQSVTQFTRHAIVRMQQRSIPPEAVDLLLDYATPTPAGNGCERFRFDNRSWRSAQSALGLGAKRFERYRSAYVVTGSDGAIVTAGWLN